MKKIYAILLLFVTLTTAALAVPPKRVLLPVRQSDGSVLMLYKHGHNALSHYSTPDGMLVKRNAEGTLCYATMQAGRLVTTDVVAHNEAQRSAEEQAFVRSAAASIERNARQLNQMVRRQAPTGHALRKPGSLEGSTPDGLGKLGTPSNGAVNSIGTVTIPVVLVEFSDVTFGDTVTLSKVSRMYNEAGYHDEPLAAGSMNDYFKRQSNGMFDPKFDVVAKVTLPGSYADYGANVTVTETEGGETYEYETDKGFDSNLTFLHQAIAKAKAAGVDFSRYEVDGAVPLIAFLYAGEGEADNLDEDAIWPHTNFLSSPIEGVSFDSYFVGNELACVYDIDWDNFEYVISGHHLDGIGTFCHEFGHALGLPDFYFTGDSNSDYTPMSYWSIMDMGSYSQDGFAPVEYIAYERSYLGWLDIPEVPAEGSVTLSPYGTKDGTPAVIVRHKSDPTIYLILENHQSSAWNPVEMGSGMLATSFWYDADYWAGNVANYSEDEYSAVAYTPEGRGSLLSYDDEDYPNHLFGNDHNTLNKPRFLDGSSLAKQFTNIAKHADGTITFDIAEATTSGAGFFDRISSTADLENGKRYLLVYEEDTNAGTAFAGMHATANYGVGADVAIDGNTIDNSDGSAVPVTLVASGNNWLLQTDEGYLAYTSTASKSNNYLWMVADASANGTLWTIDPATGSIQNVYNSARQLQYNANANGLRFACYTGSQQPVALYKEQGTTGIHNAPAAPAAKQAVFDLSGRRVSTPQRGIYVVNGRKVLVK